MSKITKSSTIFDLTDDEAQIKAIFGFAPSTKDKQDYLEFSTVDSKAVDMVTFAQLTKNDVLKKEIESVFENELLAIFNE